MYSSRSLYSALKSEDSKLLHKAQSIHDEEMKIKKSANKRLFYKRPEVLTENVKQKLIHYEKTKSASKIQATHRGKILRRRVSTKPMVYYNIGKNKNAKTIQYYTKKYLQRKKSKVTPLVRSVLNDNKNLRMLILKHKMEAEERNKPYYSQFYNLENDIPDLYVNDYNNYNINRSEYFIEKLDLVLDRINIKIGDVFSIGYTALDEYDLNTGIYAIYLGNQQGYHMYTWFKKDNTPSISLSKHNISILQNAKVKLKNVFQQLNIRDTKITSYYKKHKIY